jgi:cell surface protein SprA
MTGTLRVTNNRCSSGVAVDIQYKAARLLDSQKNFLGLRLDYLASKKLTLGATVVRLGERPFFVKESYGEDPIKNTMYGIDVDYRNNIPRLSKWLDKLPFYSTKAMSSITAYAEAAVLDPGHAKQINGVDRFGKVQKGGQVYDDLKAPVQYRSSFSFDQWTIHSAKQWVVPESQFNDSW